MATLTRLSTEKPMWRQESKSSVTASHVPVQPANTSTDGATFTKFTEVFAWFGARSLAALNWTDERAQCVNMLPEVRVCLLQSVSFRQPPAD